MIYRTLKVVVVAFALSVSGNAIAQDCGCNGGGPVGYGSYDGYGGYSDGCGGSNNCGRQITQGQAAGLWAGYCNEDCTGPESGGLFSRHRGGCGTGCGDGCGQGGRQGCFGYPAGGSGCDGGSGGRLGGGCGGRSGCSLFGGKGGGCGGRSGGGLFGGNDGGCGGLSGRSGCGLFGGGNAGECGGGCGNSRRGGGLRGSFSSVNLFRKSADCCGQTNAYFNESVGYDHGNAGMQSYVSGFSNDCGCGGSASAYPAAPANQGCGGCGGYQSQPMMSDVNQPSVEGETVLEGDAVEGGIQEMENAVEGN